MTEVMLANCRGRNARVRHEHLGLGHLKSYLATRQIDCEVVDGQFEGLAAEEVARRIVAKDPFLVGFSVFFSNVGTSLETLRILRAEGFRGHVCLGGHYATFQYKDLLQRDAAADCVVMGEGELTLAALCDRLRRSETWQDLPGLALRDGRGQPYATASRPLIHDLDQLPFPDRFALL